MNLRIVLAALSSLVLGCVDARAQTIWIGLGGNTDWSTSLNWTPTPPPNNGTDTIVFSSVLPFTSTVDTNWSISTLTIASTAGSLSLVGSPGATLTINSGFFYGGLGGSVAVDVPIAGAGNFWLNGGTGTVTLNPGAGSNTYSGSTEVIAGGTLADGEANSFSPNSLLTVGGGPITPGTVSVNFDETVNGLADAAGGHGTVNISSGRTLSVNGSLSTTYSGAITGSGSLSSGAFTLDLQGSNNYSGGTTVTSGTLLADNTSGTATGSGPITVQSGATLQIGQLTTTGIIAGANITDNGTVTLARTDTTSFPNQISGTGGLDMSGNGTGVTTLTGHNSYSGPTQLFNGTLVAGWATALGNGLSSVDFIFNGTLDLNGFNVAVGSITSSDNTSRIHLTSGGALTVGGAGISGDFIGNISGTGGLVVVGPGETLLSGTNTYTGNTTINSGGFLSLGDGATAGASMTGNVTDNGNFQFSPTASDNYLFAGTITGSGTVAVAGAATGTVTLSGPNNYSGLTSVTSGILTDGAANSFSSASQVLVDSAGTIAVKFNETVGNLQNGSGSGTVSIASGATLSSAGLNYVSDFQGVISGSGSFAVTGGVQGLSGNNTYNGGTLVSGSGELFVGSDTALGTGVLTFNGTSTEMSPDANVTLANNIVLDSVLDNDDAGPNNLTLTGQITGPSGITWCTPGALTLTNSGNNFTGGVDMREGTLYFGANNAAGTGTITLGSVSALNVVNGTTVNNPLNVTGTTVTLSGNGTIATPVTADSTIILAPSASPGGGPGNLTFSNGLVVANGATINFNIYDANGTAGTGYSLITATGGLHMAGGPNTINLDVFTINSTGAPAPAINFNMANTYAWTFATSTSAITGFNVNQFNVNTVGFLNGTAAGFFTVSGTTNNLVLNFTPVPEPSTWVLMGAGVLAIATFALRRRRAVKVQARI
jgi:fibronectin-binding autotransporter adhesin